MEGPFGRRCSREAWKLLKRAVRDTRPHTTKILCSAVPVLAGGQREEVAFHGGLEKCAAEITSAAQNLRQKSSMQNGTGRECCSYRSHTFKVAAAHASGTKILPWRSQLQRKLFCGTPHHRRRSTKNPEAVDPKNTSAPRSAVICVWYSARVGGVRWPRWRRRPRWGRRRR